MKNVEVHCKKYFETKFHPGCSIQDFEDEFGQLVDEGMEKKQQQMIDFYIQKRSGVLLHLKRAAGEAVEICRIEREFGNQDEGDIHSGPYNPDIPPDMRISHLAAQGPPRHAAAETPADALCPPLLGNDSVTGSEDVGLGSASCE